MRRIASRAGRLARHITVAAALAGAGAPVAHAQAIGITHVDTLAAQRLPALPNATHELRFTAYNFRGTRWTNAAIEEALISSASLLGQCGVAVVHAELRLIDAPRRFHYYHTPESRELLRWIDAPRPALFFVEDTKNDPAFDAEAIGLANSKPRPELVNTVWVAYGARDLPYAIAHELVHLLSNSGEHSREAGNLMRTETARGNDKLTDAQCERLRTRGEANGLLTRATSAVPRRD